MKRKERGLYTKVEISVFLFVVFVFAIAVVHSIYIDNLISKKTMPKETQRFNLVGECPPHAEEYACPMEVQETERESELWAR